MQISLGRYVYKYKYIDIGTDTDIDIDIDIELDIQIYRFTKHYDTMDHFICVNSILIFWIYKNLIFDNIHWICYHIHYLCFQSLAFKDKCVHFPAMYTNHWVAACRLFQCVCRSGCLVDTKHHHSPSSQCTGQYTAPLLMYTRHTHTHTQTQLVTVHMFSLVQLFFATRAHKMAVLTCQSSAK